MQIRLRIYLLIFGFALTLLLRFIHVQEELQFKLLMLCMIAFGVPHGALDLYIEKRTLNETALFANKVLFKYLLNIVAYAMVWYFFPLIALVLFILITAYHFGEIDWIGKSDKPYQKFTYTLIGLSWICYFLSHNVESAIKIFLYLGDSSITYNQWTEWASLIKPFAFYSMIGIYAFMFFLNKYFFHLKIHYLFSLLQLGLLMSVCYFCPLWIGFGFYFGIWHSILSFDKIRMNFDLDNNVKQWVWLLKKAFPFSIMAWLGMVFIMLLFYNSQNSTGIITLLFITLSVLTLPHLQVFTKLQLKSTEKNS